MCPRRLNMAGFVEQEARIRVHGSWNGNGVMQYRFWDVGQAIPQPSVGQYVWAQICLHGVWVDMSFNRVWGQAYDPERTGTWLKQKASRRFSTELGDRTFRVRYLVRSIN